MYIKPEFEEPKAFSTVAPLILDSDDDFNKLDLEIPNSLKTRKARGKVKREPKEEADGGGQRIRSGVAPLLSDSDEGFNGGAHTPEPARGRQRQIGAYDAARPRCKRTKRADGRGPAPGGPPKATKKLRDMSPSSRDAAFKSNPLLGLLGVDFDMILDEPESDDGDRSDSETDTDYEEIHSDIPPREQNVKTETPDVFSNKRKANFDLPPAKRPKIKAFRPAEPEDDSETDPEWTEEKELQRQAGKQSRTIDSETQTEYEEDVDEIQSGQSYGVPPIRPVSGSLDTLARSSQGTSSWSSQATARLFHTRPHFTPTPEQADIGPLVLDEQEGIQVPAAINRFLRDYQRDGVRFFWEGYKEQKGRLLGDDMGLGKTIQVISFLSAIMKRTGDARDQDKRITHVRHLQRTVPNDKLPPANSESPTCLIIAPLSVVDNWARELDAWGYFEWAKYTTAIGKNEKESVLRDFKLGRLDIILTSHDTARGDIDLLSNLYWSCIFIDEAHKVKNPKSKTTQAMHKFEHGVRFGLTGTAIQNNYEEFWTILDWTNPGKLGTLLQWKFYISEPLKLGQSSSSTPEEQSAAKRVKLALVESVLPPFFLRRTKDLIKHQLPAKTDNVVFCPLTPKQVMVYKRFLEHPDVEIIKRHTEYCDCGSREKRGKCCYGTCSNGRPWSQNVFQYMALFIKLSNHVALLYPHTGDNQEQLVRNRGYMNFVMDSFPDDPDEWLYARVQYAPSLCGKWEVLSTFLTGWKQEGGNKVLIFSKSVKLLDLIETFVQHEAYNYCRLDGRLAVEKRFVEVDKFNNDPNVFIFLISTLAGGTGLNLTAANKVVIFDPNWNPAHDLQAMDRAYRIGQARDVSVYRLLGAGSLEELIYARQLYKQAQMRIGYEGSDQKRYWSGVQGLKKGELFGVENIFTFHETGLFVKSKIEKKVIDDFCWILEHVEGLNADSGLPDIDDLERGSAGAVDFLVEEDALPQPEAVDVKPKKQRSAAKDEAKQYLEENNVYSHINDEVLQPNTVETSIKTGRKGPRRSRAGDNSRIDESWPPNRSRKDSGRRFEERLKTLMDKGYAQGLTHDEMMDEIGKITSMPPGKAQAAMAKLDALIKRRRTEDYPPAA